MESLKVTELVIIFANCRREGNQEKCEQAARVLKEKHGLNMEEMFGGEA